MPATQAMQRQKVVTISLQTVSSGGYPYLIGISLLLSTPTTKGRKILMPIATDGEGKNRTGSITHYLLAAV